MSDIFISYATEDRDRILPLVQALEKAGWSVFWDRKIRLGTSRRHFIGSKIQDSRSVLVVWTENSITSEWVLEEAETGKRRKVLIPVMLDNVEPPYGFSSIQTANLVAWNGDSSFPTFKRLVEDIASILGPIPEAVNEAEERRKAEEELRHEQKPQRSEDASKIFISYRRDDSASYAHAIYRELVQHLSKDQVFMDVETLEQGVDFERVIDEAVGECDVLIALIGKRWVNAGMLDDPEDFVRLEISTALKRGIRVIPVLVDGMTMPSADTLPDSLKSLSRRNAIEISKTRFNSDVQRLITAIPTLLEASDEDNRRRTEEKTNRAQQEAKQRRLAAEVQRKAEEERLREQERLRSEKEAKRKAEEENRRRIEEDRKRAGKFFFSYGRADAEFVLKLAADLRSNGTNVWLDQLDIPGGARWDRAVEEALHASQCLLVVLSPASVASNNVMDEVSFGLETDKRIVPILFKDCAVPFRLRRLHYIDFRAGYDDGFTRLLQALKPVDQLLMPPSALGAKATEGDTDPLERLRKQMLVARTSLELRQLLYELDAYLANDPTSPEARLLKDKMQGAIRQAEQMERCVPASPRKLPKTPIWLIGWLIGLVALGSIVYALLRFLGLL